MQASLTPRRCNGQKKWHRHCNTPAPRSPVSACCSPTPRRPPPSSAPACRTPTGAASPGPPYGAPRAPYRPGSSRLRLRPGVRKVLSAGAGTAAATRPCIMVDLVRSGRTPENWRKEFERHAWSSRPALQATRAGGERNSGGRQGRTAALWAFSWGSLGAARSLRFRRWARFPWARRVLLGRRISQGAANDYSGQGMA